MHPDVRTRRLAWWGGLLSILLGVSVFAWGLQYKLSLYGPPQNDASKVPVAKLLSRDEQPTLAAPSTDTLGGLLSGITHTASDAARMCLLLVAFFLGPLTSVQFRQRRRALLPVRSVDLDALFIRPPPAA